MQHQGPLETLGMARFKLFSTFCLPSMVRQSSQNFLWIIKTDPQFTKTRVFDLLVRAVQSQSRSHDNVYVVASNANFLFGSGGREGSWRDGREALDLLQSKIYTGNITKLHVAMALRNERPVLETRLDADDGLHEQYIEYLQSVALERFRPSGGNGIPIPRWLYWCSRRHLEWHSDTDASLSRKQKNTIGSPELGYMNVVQHDKLCVTPGITIGYNVRAAGGDDNDNDESGNTADVPQYDHDKLYKNVRNSLACYSESDASDTSIAEGTDKMAGWGRCLELVEVFLFCAIRSRTLTSAGMQKVPLGADNVPPGDSSKRQREFVLTLWELSETKFGVTHETVKDTQSFLHHNKKRIAHENLLGQCSLGHSCKDTAKEELRQIILSSSSKTTRPRDKGEDGKKPNRRQKQKQ
eukprot:jgi/Psemu1/235905/estExt_Genewise1.C_350083